KTVVSTKPYACNRQIDSIVDSLLATAGDKSEQVREAVAESLFNLGKQEPNMVVSLAVAYLGQHSKHPQPHRVCILNALHRIFTNVEHEFPSDLLSEAVQQCVLELTATKEVIPEWQTAASEVLVALSTKYCNAVMEKLMEKVQPGTTPHFFVVQTLANMAVNNPFAMIPFLPVLLSTLLPQLGSVKLDNMRWVFANAISRFCEAIVEYIANPDRAPDPNVRRETFTAEVTSAYDFMFSNWLMTAKEARLRVAIVDALGNCAQLLAREKLAEQLPRLVHGMLALYKKHPEPFHISRALANVLIAYRQLREPEAPLPLPPQDLEQLLTALFAQETAAQAATEAPTPLALKNQNEVFRCFGLICSLAPDRTVAFLVPRLEGNERSKLAALALLRHIVGACHDALADRSSLILSATKSAISDSSPKVKRALAQAVIVMAAHGYLGLEGGRLLLQFVLQGCADKEAGQLCSNVLQLMSSTVSGSASFLFPTLLEFLIPPEFADAAEAVCRAVHTLFQEQLSPADTVIDYDVAHGLPKPQALLARLLALAGRPSARSGHALRALACLAPNLHENLASLTDLVVPKLCEFLDGDLPDDAQEKWHQLMLKTVKKLGEHLNDVEYVTSLAQQLVEQASAVGRDPAEKQFGNSLAGVLLTYCQRREVVVQLLDSIWTACRHTDPADRAAIAKTAGLVATAHMDSVLERLAAYAKGRDAEGGGGGGGGGIVGFLKKATSSSGASPQERLSVLLACGQVAAQAPKHLLVSRLETDIMRHLRPYLAAKDGGGRESKRALLETLALVAEAVHPSRLGRQDYELKERDEMLKYLQAVLHAETPSALHHPDQQADLREPAMRALRRLQQLRPLPADSEAADLLREAARSVVSLPLDGGVKKAKFDEATEARVTSAVEAAAQLLETLLMEQPTWQQLERLLRLLLDEFAAAVPDLERERALHLAKRLLAAFHQHLLDCLDRPAKPVSRDPDLGGLVGGLVPRVTDPAIPVRELGLRCIELLLKLSLIYYEQEESVNISSSVSVISERLHRSDSNVMFQAVSDVGKLALRVLEPRPQLASLVTACVDGLREPRTDCASAACVLLGNAVKSRGAELYSEVDSLVGLMGTALARLDRDVPARTGLLRAVRSLCQHHLLPVLNCLLHKDLPWPDSDQELWHQLASVDAHKCLTTLLDTLTSALPYEEKADSRKAATKLPQAAVTAIGILSEPECSADAVLGQFYRLLLALSLAASVHCSVDSGANPEAIQLALRRFLAGSGCHEVLEDVTWAELRRGANWQAAMSALLAGALRCRPQAAAELCAATLGHVQAAHECHRLTACLLAEQLLPADPAGSDNLLSALLTRLADQSAGVRRAALRAMAASAPRCARAHATSLLSACLNGIDDRDDAVCAAAMAALSGLLGCLAEPDLRPILVNVCLRTRACFEREAADLRRAAFALLAAFCSPEQFATGPSEAVLTEQAQSSLVPLLLHSSDPDPDAATEARRALSVLLPLLRAPGLSEALERHLRPGCWHPGEAAHAVSRQAQPERVPAYAAACLAYFRSAWPELRAAAALLSGCLLLNCTEAALRSQSVSAEHVCACLESLLKDPAAPVRIGAAQALSLLHSY
ncbi:hypothetical protein BOX15_Mlig024729g1, partial [Macrostomum lignano]